MKFLDVKTDYAFKKVFGSDNSKDILISFLNALVEFPNDEKIVSLEIVDPYNIPMIKGMKDSYVDVKAVLDNETTVIIEMQVLNIEAFEKRVLYNAAKKYSSQLVKGEEYSLLNPVIALTIVDFEMFPESDKVITNFKLIEKESFISYNDDVELIFIELPKFNKSLEELENIKDEWIYFIKNAGDLSIVPENINPTIKNALNIVNEAGLTESELEQQHKRKDFIYIIKNSVIKAKKDGIKLGLKQAAEQRIKEGIEQGIEQGRKEERLKQEKKMIEIAKNLINTMDNQKISAITGLKIDVIEKLRIKNN